MDVRVVPMRAKPDGVKNLSGRLTGSSGLGQCATKTNLISPYTLMQKKIDKSG
jgi:hypothetical protein